MNHKSDVLFVDAETERNCGNNDMNFASHPFFLDVESLLVAETCMVKFTFDLEFPFENRRQFFTIIPRNTVNYPTLALKLFFDELGDVLLTEAGSVLSLVPDVIE